MRKKLLWGCEHHITGRESGPHGTLHAAALCLWTRQVSGEAASREGRCTPSLDPGRWGFSPDPWQGAQCWAQLLGSSQGRSAGPPDPGAGTGTAHSGDSEREGGVFNVNPSPTVRRTMKAFVPREAQFWGPEWAAAWVPTLSQETCGCGQWLGFVFLRKELELGEELDLGEGKREEIEEKCLQRRGSCVSQTPQMACLASYSPGDLA